MIGNALPYVRAYVRVYEYERYENVLLTGVSSYSRESLGEEEEDDS